MVLREKVKKLLSDSPTLFYIARKIYLFFKNTFNGGDAAKNFKNSLTTAELKPVPSKEQYPTATLIEITNTCNLKCRMCNTHLSERPNGFITPEVFTKVLDELITVGIFNTGLHTVGETFMYKDINTLLEIAEKKNFGIWISTNGQFPKRLQESITRFPKLLKNVRFSVDGAKRETYEFIRKNGSYDKLFESLEFVHSFNRGIRDFRIEVAIDSILNTTNIKEIPDYFRIFSKYCLEKNINFSLINALSPDNSYFDETFPWKNLSNWTVPCVHPFNYVYFTYGGKVTLCCRDYEEEIVVGDIQKDSLIDIWNNETSESIRDMHLGKTSMKIDACKTCFEPYSIVATAANNYIHKLYNKSPKMESEKFGKHVEDFLTEMNDAIGKNGIVELRKVISKALD